MIAFPHAKINLGLSIVAKRPDGFHNLESIFYPLPLRDVLEIVPTKETRFFPTGLPIPGLPSDNLVLLAYQKLKKKYPQIEPLDIYLHKSIPMGAGLGGGSADAAEILQLLNKYFNLGISINELNGVALGLGSDCPFFLQSAPCYVTGRGEILEPVELDLSGYSFLLVHPDLNINTAWAFSKVLTGTSKPNLKDLIRHPVSNWKKYLHNDFESPVFQAHPSLRKIKDRLYDTGALFASMTGSGSTIFGIFNKGMLPEISLENARQSRIY